MRADPVPVVVDNDANTAALAECRFGAGVGHRYVLCITLGTGIGGALVHRQQVFRGANGMAGEFGHMQVVPGRPPVRVRQPRAAGSSTPRATRWSATRASWCWPGPRWPTTSRPGRTATSPG